MKDENAVLTVELAKDEIAPIVRQANALTIKTAEEYERAGRGVMVIKGQAKRIDAELIEPWRVQKRHADGEMKKLKALLLDPLTQAEAILKGKQTVWHTEQKRIREDAEREAMRKAEEEAERERQRLLKEAAKRKTDEARERLLEKAEAVQVKPVEIIATAPPKIAGQHYVTRWTAKVKNAQAAINVIMTWPDWFNYVELKQGALDKWAARTKGQVKLDGVEVTSEQTMASRSM